MAEAVISALHFSSIISFPYVDTPIFSVIIIASPPLVALF
jgi:hypothetical protein